MAAWRASLGATASRVYPGLDAAVWNAQRNRLAGQDRRRPWTAAPRPAPGPSDPGPRLVIITTGDGPESPEWHPAAGNHIFEVAQSAIDLLGADRVLVTHVPAGEPPAAWHDRVIGLVMSFGATHVLGNVETDPHDSAEWTWDLFCDRLATAWPGIFLGLMYDSAFEWTTIKGRRLAERGSRVLLVALDRPLGDELPGARRHVGPVLLPLSLPTQAIVEEALADVVKDIPVSFIGALYDYRVPILDALIAAGVAVAVNPQRLDVTRTYAESRTDQPGYVDYMRTLARSEITVNLSRAHTEETKQLKTRILEGSFAGCLVATDDADRSDHYFTEGAEFARFGSVADGSRVLPALLADPDRLAAMQAAARARARAIADSVFWGAVDSGLRASGMPPLLPEPTP
jgi:hypothetical protein